MKFCLFRGLDSSYFNPVSSRNCDNPPARPKPARSATVTAGNVTVSHFRKGPIPQSFITKPRLFARQSTGPLMEPATTMPQPKSAASAAQAAPAAARPRWEKPELVRLEPGSPAHDRAMALLRRQHDPS